MELHEAIKSERRRLFLDFAFLLGWLGLFIFLAFRHVSWRDEYQAWIVATRTDSWAEFFDAVRHERSPPLFYLMLRGVHAFAGLFSVDGRAGFAWGKAVAYAFSISNVVLWVRAFDLPRGFRYGVPLGILFLMDYGIFARSYSMGIFLLFAAAWAWRTRRMALHFLLLGLAGATHLCFTLIAGAIVAASCYDVGSSRERWRGLALSLPLLAASVVSQWPPSDSMLPISLNAKPWDWIDALVLLSYGLTGLDGILGDFEWNSTEWLTEYWILASVPVGVLIYSARAGFPALRFFGVVAAPLWVQVSAYGGGLRHVGIFYVTLLYMILVGERRAPRVLLLFVVTMCFATTRWIVAWKPYQVVPEFDASGWPEVVEKAGPYLTSKKAVLLMYLEGPYYPVAAELGIDLYDIRRDQWISYPYLSYTGMKNRLSEWCRLNRETLGLKFPGNNVYLGLTTNEPPEECKPYLEVFASSRATLGGDTYRIFLLVDLASGKKKEL